MAEDIKLSATRIGSFLQCIQRYKFQYIDHLPKVPSPAFRLGLAVHESLELAGNIWKEKGKFTKTDIKKILDKYVEISIREGIEDKQVHEEGLKLVSKRLKKFDLGKIIDLEKKFGFNSKDSVDIVTEDGVKLIGAIDKVVEIDPETLLVVDYKTSKTAPTANELKTDVQLSIYDLVASMLWPNYQRIILCLDMLRSEPIYSYRTIEERKEFSEYLTEIHKQMSNLKKKDMKARLNIFCPWCDYKEYCDEYKKACKKSDYKFLATASLSADELIKEWETVRSSKRILDARERELNMLIMERIRDSHTNLINNEEEVYIRQNSRTTYKIDTVFEYSTPEAFVKMVSGLNKKAVEEYMKDNPAVMDKIKKDIQVNYTAPFLAVKKRKGIINDESK